MDLGIFQERKVMEGIYMRYLGRYQVAATAVPIPHRGGINVFYCKAENFTLEAIRLHGPNVISFQMATGGKRWHVVGCYIAMDETSTI